MPDKMTTFLIKDVRIFTGETEIPNGYVHVQDGLIASVGVTVPSDVLDAGGLPVLSKPGHTLLPGLIDCHIHADKGQSAALTQSLKLGVTTVMDMHNEPWNVSKLRALAAGDYDCADPKFAGVAATIENGWPVPVVTAHDKSEATLKAIATWPKLATQSDVDAYMHASVHEHKSDYIKLMHESGAAMGWQFAAPTPTLQKMIVDAAHAAGKVAVAHATCLHDHLIVLAAGVDGLTHAFYDTAPTAELVRAYVERGAWLNPTLVAIGSLTAEGQAEQLRFSHADLVRRHVPDASRERMCRCMGFRAEGASVEFAYEAVRMLKAAGVDILVGSDSASPALGTAWGASIHHELALFVDKCGFSPAEALRSATGLTARRFGFADRGVIEQGRRADLLLVEGNVCEDIAKSLEIRGVWREGRLCSAYADVVR